MKYVSILIVLLLSGCKWDVEEAEEVWDPRLIENAKAVCESHGGIDHYIKVSNLNEHVICFDRTTYDIRSKKVME